MSIRLILIRVNLVLLMLSLLNGACGPGRLSGRPVSPPTNPCFEGIFSDGEITLGVVETEGSIAAVGWKEPGFVAPWENLSFDGVVLSGGNASGIFRIHFPPEVDSEGETIIPIARFALFPIDLSDGDSCATRNILSFSLESYEFDGTTRSDLSGRALTRQP